MATETEVERIVTLRVPQGVVVVTHDELRFEPVDGRICVPENVAKNLIMSHRGYSIVPAESAIKARKA